GHPRSRKGGWFMSGTSGSSPIPWLTPQEYTEWRAAYAAELANGPGDEGLALRRAGERTAHLWGVRIAPDGTVGLNPDRLLPEIYAEMVAAQAEAGAGSRQETAAPPPVLISRPGPAASPSSGQAAQGIPAALDSPGLPGGRPGGMASRRAGQSG